MIKFVEIINSKLFKCFLGIFSILYSISFIIWNLWVDSYYYYLLFPEYKNYPMMSLTLYIGNLFIRFISPNMLWVNFLSWLLCFLSITLIYFSYVQKGNRFKYVYFYFSGLIVLGYGTFTLYGPDTLSLFFLSLIGCCLCKKHAIDLHTILVVSVMSAALIAARFPNILILPLVIGYMIVKDFLQKMRNTLVVYHLLTYLVLTTVLYIVLQYMLLGTTDIFTALVEEFTVSISSYNTHTLSNLISVYRGDFYVTLKDLLWFVGAISIPYLCGVVKNRPKCLQLGALLPLLYMLYKEKEKLLGTMYGWKNLYAFLIILLMIILIIKKKKPVYTLDSLLFISLGFIMAAGSDTGFMKIGVFFSVITPIVVIEYERLIKFNFFSKALFTIVLCYSLYYYGMQFWGNHPFAFIKYSRATQLVSLEQKQRLLSKLSDAEKYGEKDHCIFTGISGFQAQAIIGSKMLYKCSFWQKKNDDIETSNIVKVMQSDTLCTVFDYNKSELLMKKMNNIGIKGIQTDLGVVYKHAH